MSDLFLSPGDASALYIDGLLHEKYGADPWFYTSEVPNGTGLRRDARTIDGLAVNVWPSQFRILAFEVKVSRADFLNDVKTPAKRAPFVEACSEFYYVTPHGLVAPEEVPEECGLMYAQNGGRVVTKKVAQQRKVEGAVPLWLFLAMTRKRGQAYNGKPVFKYAGRDLSREEFDALVAEEAERRVKPMRREIEREVEAKYEDDYRLARFLRYRYADLGIEPAGENPTASEIEAWARGVRKSGAVPGPDPMLVRALEEMERQLTWKLHAVRKAAGIETPAD